ncbi:MAG: DEAD/DEAH box helicase [Synergistaceae bacterium]|jgi:superfamily II DNA or RNA helicase|nr:DEAD/DEAH box helicase [Synergistaceae bacterium]
MFFDDALCKKLLDRYNALPEREKRAYRLLAVIGVPVTAQVLQETLNTIPRLPSPSASLPKKDKDYSSNEVSSMLTRWTKNSLVRSTSMSFYSYNSFSGTKYYCDPYDVELVTRDSLVAYQDYRHFNRVIDGTVIRIPALIQAIADAEEGHRLPRLLRRVVYDKDPAAFSRLFSETAIYSERAVEGVLLRILFIPLDKEMLLNLPEEIGSRALSAAFDTWWDAAPEQKVLNGLLERYYRKYPSNPLLRGVEFKRHLDAGREDEIEKMLRETGSIQFSGEDEAVYALAALLKGNCDKALALYEEGLKRLRKTNRKRYGYFTWRGVFYPLLLLRAKAPEKKIRENLLLDKYSTQIPWAYQMIAHLLENGADRRKNLFASATVNHVRSTESPIDVLVFMLCVQWIAPEKTGSYVKNAVKACRKLVELGMPLMASHLASILRKADPAPAKEFHVLPELSWHLEDLLEYRPDWAFSLDKLKALGGPPQETVHAEKLGTKRLAWIVNWKNDTKGKTEVTSIVPMEQTLQVKGWSRGKNVSFRRLAQDPNSVESLADRDKLVLPAIHAYDSYHYGEYYISMTEGIRALAGHPFLFGQEGESVEVFRSEPRILTLSQGGEYKLIMDPHPDPTELKIGLIVTEDAPGRLKLVDLDAKHLKIAEILGPEGLYVPSGAKDEVLETLSSLASIVTVHADVEGVESGADYVEPDTRLYVQMQPYEEGLQVEVLTRPLGPESAACTPGVGAANLYGLVSDRRVQTKRDLEGESKVLDAFLEKCVSALNNAYQTSDQAENRWVIQDAEASLEFLLALQEMGDQVVAEWPKGGKRQVRGMGSFSSSLSVRDADHWFSVSGELKLDEDVVFGMKEILRRLESAKGRFIQIGHDEFLALTDSYRRKLETLAAVGDLTGDEIRISSLSAALLGGMDEDVDSFTGSRKWKKQTALIDEAAALKPKLPRTFRGELREYQEEGYRWLARLAHWGAGACLADDMGLGKTIQTLALLLARAEGGPALVVAPTSVCSNWIEEAGRFTPTLNMKELRYGDRENMVQGLEPMDVLITSYSLLQNERDLLSGVNWHTIVLDEAQAIKNMGTKRSASAMRLSGDFRVITTGTPIENNLTELWNLFRFINPHYLGSHESFSRKFALPIERDGDKAVRKRLKKVIAPFLLRRNKEQVLSELPPKTEVTLRVELKEEERNFYEALRRNALEDLARYDGTDKRFKIFAQLVKLRRACCNSALVAQGEVRYPSAKLEAFSEVMDDLRAGGHKALVFSQFVDHLTLLRKVLDEKGVLYQYLDGSTLPSERTKRVRAFQTGSGDCFLISLKAGGMGLNLTAADYVIHMDPWWNPAVEEQASDRTHRIGQQRPVTVYRIVAKDTIEEKIVDLHSWKRDLANSLLDEAEVPVTLSADEMLKLLAEA